MTTEPDTSAAFAPTGPPPPEPERYRVTAPSAVLEHEPGSEFTATLDPEHRAFLLACGALALIPDTPEQPEPAAPAAKPKPKKKEQPDA